MEGKREGEKAYKSEEKRGGMGEQEREEEREIKRKKEGRGSE